MVIISIINFRLYTCIIRYRLHIDNTKKTGDEYRTCSCNQSSQLHAAHTFSASQVCQIVTGDDGNLDYVFPGSDDELDTSLEDSDLEDMDHLESEIDAVRSSDAESQCSGVEREGGGAGGRGGSAVGRGNARGRGCGTGDRGGSAGGRGSSARSRGRGVRGHDHGSDQDGPAGENSWSDTGSSVNVEPFTIDVGPTIPLEDPSDIFMTFFTPQLLEHIVTKTKRFACQCLSATHEGKGPPTWETNAEMKAYMGFAILMGINRLPDLYDYWSTITPLPHAFLGSVFWRLLNSSTSLTMMTLSPEGNQGMTVSQKCGQ